MKPINWNEQFKIRTTNSEKSMDKHEVVKLLLVRRLIEKYKRNKEFIRIYTEFPLENGLRPDVYFENTKTKEAYAFEIQKEFTKKWLKEKTEKYSGYSVPFFNSFDFIPINLNEFPDDIQGINKKLEEYLV